MPAAQSTVGDAGHFPRPLSPALSSFFTSVAFLRRVPVAGSPHLRSFGYSRAALGCSSKKQRHTLAEEAAAAAMVRCCNGGW